MASSSSSSLISFLACFESVDNDVQITAARADEARHTAATEHERARLRPRSNLSFHERVVRQSDLDFAAEKGMLTRVPRSSSWRSKRASGVISTST